MDSRSHAVAVVGTGPAGLMAASILAANGCNVELYERKAGPGRKLLIAGSSGLNVTFHAPLPEFLEFYRESQERLKPLLEHFPPQAWISFINKLGIETFLGTSNRYFVQGLKASKLLRAWLQSLEKQSVQLHMGLECSGFESLADSAVLLRFSDGSERKFGAVCFALGGGSYEPIETPLGWPRFFSEKGIQVHPFAPSNSGFCVRWSPAFLKESEGQPLKNIILTTPKGSRRGELVVTHYGLEGTPIYALGQSGPVWLDLKPELEQSAIEKKLAAVRENLSPLRRAKRVLNLSPTALSLLFHHGMSSSVADFAREIKQFKLNLEDPRPLSEAISSKGGLDWKELNPDLMLVRHPGIFAAGEMIDWDAPTGGFLIQACVSSGYVAAQGILRYRSQYGF